MKVSIVLVEVSGLLVLEYIGRPNVLCQAKATISGAQRTSLPVADNGDPPCVRHAQILNALFGSPTSVIR